jgi:hypothetical protein
MPGVRIKKEVRFRDLQGELVLLNLRTGVYFGLDPVGSRIWQLIEDRRSSTDIVEALLAEYDVARAECEADVREFLAALRDNELVDTDDG